MEQSFLDLKSLMAAAVLPTDTVDVPGGKVAVRGLSRAEVVAFGNVSTKDELENQTLAIGMTDPAMTVEEAAAWRAVAPSADVKAVSDAILELSGLGEGAQTAKERRFRST